jgi:exportin-1
MQVAVLSFGDFYDAQFVKLYTIFMVQLQVQNHCSTINDGGYHG